MMKISKLLPKAVGAQKIFMTDTLSLLEQCKNLICQPYKFHIPKLKFNPNFMVLLSEVRLCIDSIRDYLRPLNILVNMNLIKT